MGVGVGGGGLGVVLFYTTLPVLLTTNVSLGCVLVADTSPCLTSVFTVQLKLVLGGGLGGVTVVVLVVVELDVVLEGVGVGGTGVGGTGVGVGGGGGGFGVVLF